MPKLDIKNLTTGTFVLQDPSGVTLFNLSVPAGTTVSKTITSDAAQNIEQYLIASAAAKQITYTLYDDSTSTTDRVSPNVRTVVTSPDYMAATDDIVCSKLTVAGAVSIMLPGPHSMIPIGKTIEVWDTTGDGSTNNVSVIASLHVLQIAAINTGTLGVQVGDLVTLASDAVNGRAGTYTITKVLTATLVEVLELIPGARGDNGNATVSIKDHTGTITRLAPVAKSVTTTGDAGINAGYVAMIKTDGGGMLIRKSASGWVASTIAASPAS